ncbi:hypothetical protein BCR32DRAFT_290354 [Anaeromyces robustus]|uniref:Uncharacterized protein n=1 Tax=Anaeromyces robustus TaxID=1754192 RepID=A0A1Y1XJG5_9FUNG|nr:hypothetical protein BCR32DRAFT_290354 [Anaeromyces robustus]|eukprot:ORX85890.1 hypothetical protein BCR32DRAFT_290354 [Anaeromyces robustus]
MDEQKENDNNNNNNNIINKIKEKVLKYFKENDLEDLMNYGSDLDEGLYHLTTLYQEILNEIPIKYQYIYTEDGLSDGKYVTTINFGDEDEIKVDTSAWNGIDIVKDNIIAIYERSTELKTFKKKKQLEIQKSIKYMYEVFNKLMSLKFFGGQSYLCNLLEGDNDDNNV